MDAAAEKMHVASTGRPRLAALRHQARIVVVIASSEFKLKYAGSALGYVWSVLKPLGLFGMLYVVFGRFLRLGSGTPHYPLYLLLGIVLWTYFSDATLLGMKCVVERSTLISKLAFPRVIIPLSVIVSSAITLAVNLVAIAVLIAVNRVVPGPSWAVLLPLLLELCAVAFGITLVLSTLYVRFRDVGQALDGISFQIEEGECFSIIGPNGSGRSTLMKVIASIYRADSSGLLVRGRLSPFIELGVGFNPELTGRDNVRINGTLRGLSKSELGRRYDAIVGFAEPERFIAPYAAARQAAAVAS